MFLRFPLWCCLAGSLCALPFRAAAQEVSTGKPTTKASFNFEIKPLLANACFACHGPDEKTRKAKLRLDVAEEAYGKSAWKPGHPEESEAIKRIFSKDPDEAMPPPDSRHSLKDAERELLRRWVAEGAVYERHWAFVPPVAPAVPEFQAAAAAAAVKAPVENNQNSNKAKAGINNKTGGQAVADAIPPKTAPADFPIRSAVDAFVLQKLRDRGLEPSGPAARELWLRRVTFDLTGLPPTTAELDAFLADQQADAFEKAVDRLLASTAFGERLAVDWLDAARYADSYGRHEDADSPVWPYRDWVIRAFNENLSYDQFILWQTAGDLLPGSTQEQKLATTFNRLTNQSNEAGSNEEEFRHEIIADRVKTNATAILGLTMECARCHDHKYDPISTKEYYSFAAYLNNIDELGLYSESTAGIPAPTMYVFNDAQKKQHDALREAIRAAGAKAAAAALAAKERWKTWKSSHAAPPPAEPSDWFSFENEAKRGDKEGRKKVANSMRPNDEPNMFRLSPQYLEGVWEKGVEITGENSVQFKGRAVYRRSDAFSFSLWIKATKAQERVVLLHRSVAGLEAASRGYEILLNQMHPEFSLSHVMPGNSIRLRGGFPLTLNKWNHIAATYDGSSRAAGMRLYINGRLLDAEVVSDCLYKDITYRAEWGDYDASKVQDNTRPPVELTLGNRYNDMGAKDMVVDELKVFPLVLTAAEVTQIHSGELPADDDAAFQRYLRDVDEPHRQALQELHAARTAEDDFVSSSQELMVMRERAKPRETHVLARGQFDQPTEKVSAATPANIWAMPADFPQNRLGLARWYVDARNPLTARVAVNRLWQLFFGQGLVATAEDFGIQGRLPSHPELLDWLACDFRENGWNVKRLCRRLALSSAYRQASHPDAQRLEADPDNALLSRGPKVRLPAEMLRDLALKAADMLNPQMGGRPVRPYQPENLYEDSGVQLSYKQDHGAVIWKRSVYLYRKRTLPLPFLTTFDASTREYCRVRRERTTTPLQALTLLNAPDFVEPCRVLAEKALAKKPADILPVLTDSYRRFTGRVASAQELKILKALHDEQLAYYAAHPDQAEALVSKTGEFPADKSLPPAAVAALTMVHRMMLSDDDAIMKK